MRNKISSLDIHSRGIWVWWVQPKYFQWDLVKTIEEEYPNVVSGEEEEETGITIYYMPVYPFPFHKICHHANPMML